jgi:hypothetical protein
MLKQKGSKKKLRKFTGDISKATVTYTISRKAILDLVAESFNRPVYGWSFLEAKT